MRSLPERRPSKANGFTLLEVLVALAIMAIGVGALVAAVGNGLGYTGIADRYIEATRRAESRLAGVGLSQPLVPGDSSGDDGDGFAWHLHVSGPAQHAVANAAAGPKPVALFGVVVTISWPSGHGTRQVTLRSERLGAPGNGSP